MRNACPLVKDSGNWPDVKHAVANDDRISLWNLRLRGFGWSRSTVGTLGIIIAHLFGQKIPFGWSHSSMGIALSFHLTCWNEHSHSEIKRDSGCHETNNAATGSSASNHALRSNLTLSLSRKLEPGKEKRAAVPQRHHGVVWSSDS